MKNVDKNPDATTQTLQNSFMWAVNNAKMFAVLAIVLVVGGAGYAAYAQMQKNKETQVQAELALIESQVDKKKMEVEKQKADAVKGAKDKTPPPAVSSADYSTEIENYKQLIDKNPNTNAAKLAAMSLSDILLESQKAPEALPIFQKLNLKKTDNLTGLLLMQFGTVQAETGDCDGALANWSKITEQKKWDFLHGATKLKMGTCYEKKNDMAKAEAMYSEAKAANQAGVSETADRYLKLMKFSN